MNKFSFNFHPQNMDRNKALSWVASHKPETIVSLNDKEFASSCADLGVKYPILRITNNDDEIQLKLRSFKEWWEVVKAEYVDKRLLVHFANESHTDLNKLSQLCSEGMKILHDEGHRGVFGNFSVGTPNRIDLNSSLTSMLDSFKIYPEMFLGVHEYFMGDPLWCIPDFITRSKQFGSIPTIFTEFGFDFIPQIAQAHNLPNLRGWKSHAKYYKGDEEKLVSMLKEALSVSNVVGVNFFCFGDSGGWDDYNAEHWDVLLNGDFSVTQTITTVPSTAVTIKGKSGNVNRRNQPSTSAGMALTPLTIVPVSVNKIAVTNDGWTQYIFTDGTFWLNDAVIEIVSDVTISVANASPNEIAAFKDLLQKLHDFIVTHDVEFS